MPLITPADDAVRPHPWLTYLLGVALIAAFWSQQISGGPAMKRSAASIANATEYFEQNPTVALDPRFELVLGVVWVEEVRARHLYELRSKDRPLLSGFLQRRQQEKFDELEQQALVDLDQLPVFRYGVSDRDTPYGNFWTHVFVNQSGFYLGLAIFFLLAAGAALECSWGISLYALLCVISVGTAAGVAALLHEALSAPWVGTTGLMAGLLGASLVAAVRKPPLLLGAVPMPGWLLLPAFAVTELMRQGGLPAANSVLLLAPAAAAGAGLVFATGVGLTKRSKQAGERGGEANPVVARAKRALAAQQPDRAIDLLMHGFELDPEDCTLALALWKISRDHGDPTAASEAMLTVIREHLRRGRTADVADCWMELVLAVPGMLAEAPLLVRVGQALLDEGEADEALRVLRAAVDGSDLLPSAQLLRVIRVARDLDPALAKRVAEMALADPLLADTDRVDLQRLVAAPAEEFAPESAGSLAETVPIPLPEATSAAAQPRVELVELVELAVPPPGRSEAQAGSPSGPDELVEDLSSELADLRGARRSVESGRDGVADSWQSEGREPDASAAASADTATLDPNALAPDALTRDASENAAAGAEDMERWNDPSLIDAADDDLSGDTQGMNKRLAATDEQPQPEEIPSDSRPLKLVCALPISLEDGALALEIEGRGKISLSYHKIDALAAAAVRGLGPRPVLVVDLVLNWMSLTAEPLRVIRFRSDQFDPRKLVPAASSATQALRALLGSLLRASDATPLPDADAAHGRPFVEFPNLMAYEQEVLMVDGAGATGPGHPLD